MFRSETVLVLLYVLAVLGTSRRHGNRRGRHGNGVYGNETVIESRRNGQDHLIRIILPNDGFIVENNDDIGQTETSIVADEMDYSRCAASPMPPKDIVAYRMKETREQWTQAQVNWKRNREYATGYRIRYTTELSGEESDSESSRTVHTVRVNGTVNWVDITARGRILAVSIATECHSRCGPYSGAYQLKPPSDHPDSVEIQDIRSRSTTCLEVTLWCKNYEYRGLNFIVLAHPISWSGARTPGATKTWSFRPIITGGPVFNLTGLRPRSTYEVEVRNERKKKNGKLYGPWSEYVRAETLSNEHDQMVMVRNTAVPMRMYGPPLKLNFGYVRANTVRVNWYHPKGLGPCMSFPSKYRVTYGPRISNQVPEMITDIFYSSTILELKRNDEVDYMLQVVALDRDLIPSLWASDMLIIPKYSGIIEE